MIELPSLVTALGGALAAIGGVAVLIIKARNQGAEPKQLLRRWLDWADTRTVTTADVEQRITDMVPPRLRADTERMIEDGDDR